MSSSSNQLQSLMGLSPSSPKLSEYLASLSDGKAVADPEVKSYPDAVYFNYYALGLSLLFSPQKGYKPKVGLKYTDLETQKLVLDSLDVYNVPKPVDPAKAGKTGSSRSEIAFTTFPATPLTLTLASVQDKDGKDVSRPESITISTTSTGQELVGILGEPDRKGGGAGPSSGSIGIWCEWSKDGLMIEFGGDDARGPGAWERGKDAVWKVITLFQPKNP